MTTTALSGLAVAPSIDTLFALYAGGRYDFALKLAREAMNTGSTDARVYQLAARCTVRLGRHGEFKQMMRAAGSEAVLLGTWTLNGLLDEEAFGAIASVERATPPDEPIWLIATYYSGCASMMQGRQAEAMEKFRAFRLSWPRFLSKIDLIHDDRFNVRLRQGRLIAEPAELERRMTIEVKLPPLDFIGDAEPGRPVVLATGNNHYFNAMGPTFVDGMLPALDGAMLHLHVIDPDRDSLALIEDLSARHGAQIAFSLERTPLFRTYTYYSCSRFYTMGALLDRYRAPILSFDIDIVPAPEVSISDLFGAAAPYDFCCFRTQRNEPASIFQASVMYWPDRIVTRAFIDGLQHFCWEELRNPSRTSWMLDQAGLFSLLSDPAWVSSMRYGDFSALTGRELSDWVKIAFDNQVKGELRFRTQKDEPTDLVIGSIR